MFIGRKKELKNLHALTSKQIAHLIVCIGRRRIGKSTLIKEFSKKDHQFLELQGLAPREGLKNQEQLANFAEQLSRQSQLPSLNLRDWTEAFSMLNSVIKNKKTVILLDEISWLASADPDFLGKLKIAWDTLFKHHPKLVIVICGSVTSWISENILNNTDFLGRISLTINLEELQLPEINQFWPKTKNISSYEKFKIIALTGGVPRYLEEIDFKKTAEENIHSLCFQREGVLYDEFEKIFHDIFNKKAKTYSEIIEHLILGSKSFIEICNKLKVEKNGVITKYLKDLEISGFIERNYVYKFDGKISKLSKFRIKDNYLRFYLKYVKPQKDKIKKNIFDQLPLENLPMWPTIMGLQFEATLLNNLSLLIDKLGISKSSIISASPYFQTKTTKNKGGCQIDLLIQTSNKILYICEFKFKFKDKITDSIIQEMDKKIDALSRPKNYSVRTVLIYEGKLNLSAIAKEPFFKILHASELLKP